ncbi:MAG: TonB-dependent receptor domain-containing protein [bacterium]
MKKIVATLTFFAAVCFSQPRGPANFSPAAGVITGQVVDAEQVTPIEYANVVLYRMRDTSFRPPPGADTSRLVTGTVTDVQGRFVLREVPPGRFYLEVSFIGFKTRRVEDIRLAPDGKLELGRITLEPVAISMPGAEVTAEKPKIEYKIDKKILNVAQDPTLQSGTAVDALEKAPSVKVDLEGNVSLRGLSSFTVLIDGRPSPIEGSEALQQIPAVTIDRVEIVTNPSVKYDPEGKAGIINVILKKQRSSGLSGVLNLNAGTNSIYGGNLLLNLRQGIATFYFSPNLNQMNFPGTREVNRRVERNDTTYYNYSTGTMNFGRRFYGLRFGTELQPNPQNYLSFGARLGGISGSRGQEAEYREWSSVSADTLVYQGGTTSIEDGNQIFAHLDANHNFGKNEHQLIMRLNYGSNGRNGSDKTENRIVDTVFSGKRTSDVIKGYHVDLKLDYSLPLRAKDRFEAGYQVRWRRRNQKNSFARFNPEAGSYESLEEYRHTTAQSDDAQAVYSSYTLNQGPLGAMLGLRTEFTGRRLKVDTFRTTPVNRWDFFPSLHISYKFPLEHQVMASYTRRIDRPRGWDLAPETTWMDANNVRTGNPNLLPEFIDSYEAGLVFPMGKNRLSLDGYYRVTHNVIERFQRVWQGAVMLNTVENVGTDYALGAEFNFDFTPFPLPFWNINLTGDIYDYRLQAALPEVQNASSFNWDGGVTTFFNLPTMTRIQFTVRYESPSATAQGKMFGRVGTSAGIRQALFKRQLVLTFSVQDFISSSFHESETRGENFFTYIRLAREKPTVYIGLTWNFNNYKLERRRQNGEGEDEEITPIYEVY